MEKLTSNDWMKFEQAKDETNLELARRIRDESGRCSNLLRIV